MLIFSLSVNTIACGQEEQKTTKKQSYIEPEFEYFVDLFEIEQNVMAQLMGTAQVPNDINNSDKQNILR